MKKLILLSMLIISSSAILSQNVKIGHPNRSGNFDLKGEFANPPKGYGQVPFYWWLGDTLTREHLTWQLDELKDKKISSLQVNYAHSDVGGESYGYTYKSQPNLFTDQWWELFEWFMGEAGKRGMTVSLSDYTLGVGQDSYVDNARRDYPEVEGSELNCEQKEFNGRLDWSFEVTPLSLVVYSVDNDGQIIPPSAKVLTDKIKGGNISYDGIGKSLAVMVYAKPKPISFDPMNPISGRIYCDYFFQQFENKCKGVKEGGLNFFFSDELDFKLRGFLWNSVFSSEFKKRKGYAVEPYLANLFVDGGDISPKIRLDYNDVMVSLSEENFFEPVYRWHEDRGLIYGCDHGGRGRDVIEFGDYFRTQRWNQAPGCDQPRFEQDVVKNKVAASIAHLYERPRVWLEGFHSSGWGSSSADVTDAIFGNFIMGHNLLSLHGLYYSTPGGWWEWAPPCNHFRMPYWQEMTTLLSCSERLSYILSQGYHRADVAVLFPVESEVAGYGVDARDKSFEVGEYLYNKGIDFDFMDYESLARCKVKDGRLIVAGEEFAVVVVPSMKAIRHSSLLKLAEFVAKGGVVITYGDKAIATDLKGVDAKSIGTLYSKIHPSDKNVVSNVAQVLDIVEGALPRDFKVLNGDNVGLPRVMHRKINDNDLYAVYNVPKGAECLFRAKGSVQIFDPWTGEVKPLEVKSVTSDGTIVEMPLDTKEMQIIMFDPKGKSAIAEAKNKSLSEVIKIEGEWGFEIKPTLDNSWGDFIWPATNEKVGANVYSARHNSSQQPNNQYLSLSYNDNKWSNCNFSYGDRFMILDKVDSPIDTEKIFESIDNNMRSIGDYDWQPYGFSWRFGNEHDAGLQGYHGLKEIVHDEFIRLGNIRDSWDKEKVGSLRVSADGNDNYYLYTNVYAERDGEYEICYSAEKPSFILLNRQNVDVNSKKVHLQKGANSLLLYYDTFGASYVIFKDNSDANIDPYFEKERPIASSFRGDCSILPFSNTADSLYGYYRFNSAPALESFDIKAYGELERVYVNGTPCKIEKGGSYTDGLTKYRVTVLKQYVGEATVAIEIKYARGCELGAAIDGPIYQHCGKGKITIGDWSKREGLRNYSGGVLYSNSFTLNQEQVGRKVVLNLGDVVSTARVIVNGKEVGLKMSAPWNFDISSYVKSGSNEVEVLVYNTASNHYLSIPTNFRGEVTSGLLTPVTLEVY